MNFEELGISLQIIKGLNKESIKEPTKVQEAVIGKIIENKDLVVQSETGSGKTLAYLLPLYEKMLPPEKGMKVLILVPTHELAVQVSNQVKRLSDNSETDIKAATILGNVNINRQIDKLKEKPQIIIGTPGRILELIKKKKIHAHKIETIVVDEADKMIDRNNIEVVKSVIKCCMRDTQLLMFSASINKKTLDKAIEILKNPEFVSVSEKIEIPKNIEHIVFVVERREKIEMFRKIAKSINPDKALVFINKETEIEEATEKLRYHNYNVACIHGTKRKNERKNAVENFRNGKTQFLIATDIAARGLHIEGISAVFHLSIPEESQDYLHRAGRTGRNNEKGLSILIVGEEEVGKIKALENALNIKIIPKKMYKGEIVDI